MYGAHDDIGDFVLWRSDEAGTATPELEVLINDWWHSTAETAPLIYARLRVLAEQWSDHPDYPSVEPKV